MTVRRHATAAAGKALADLDRGARRRARGIGAWSARFERRSIRLHRRSTR